MARLQFSTQRQPRGGVIVMLVVSLCLLALSLYHVWQGSTPQIIPLIMLLASLTLLIGFSLALYRSKPLYRINVVMLDGTAVALTRRKKPAAVKLLDGLTNAMDWHRMGNIELDAQRSSHLRQGVAHGRQASARGSVRTAGVESASHAQKQSRSRSRKPAMTSSRTRVVERGRTVGRQLARRISHAWQHRAQAVRTAQSSDEPGSAGEKARAVSRKSAGPVVAMKEVSVRTRLKALFDRLRGLLSR